MRGHPPVFVHVVFIWIVLLVISEEVVKLDALSEILSGLEASNVLKEIEVTVNVDACADKSMPHDALELDVGVVLLELELNSLAEVDVRTLDGVHVFTGHLELIEVEVLREHLHIYFL